MARKQKRAKAQRRKTNRLVHKIYTLFRGKNPWKVKLQRIKNNLVLTREYSLSRDTLGYCYDPDRFVSVDFREEILDIFVHECLHAAFPKKEEEEIEELEEFLMENISPLQAKRLLKTMADNLI